jgi:glucose-6-phosphate 1-dehydrogenase
VPFYVRAGKRLETKATEIVLQFRTPPHIPFALEEPLKADRLILRVSPEEGIDLRFNAKTPGQSVSLDRVSLSFSYGSYFGRPNPDAYETLVLDVMQGDATLFMRADEVEAQWRVIEPLLARSEEPPVFYGAGSMGPRRAYELLEKSHRTWRKPKTSQPNGAAENG